MLLLHIIMDYLYIGTVIGFAVYLFTSVTGKVRKVLSTIIACILLWPVVIASLIQK